MGNGGFSNVFHPSGGEHMCNAPEAYMIPPVIRTNPLVQTDCDLSCPYCQSSLRTWRWNDCKSLHSMSRTLFFIQERILLVSCRYLRGDHHQVLARDPELLKGVHKQAFKFPILFHKSGMTKELFNFISSSTQAGLCIQDIKNMLLNLHNFHHCSRAYLCYS